MSITLYHPDLKETIEVPDERSAEVHKAAGWTEKVPRTAQAEKPAKEGSS
jgi:hypothetical protein